MSELTQKIIEARRQGHKDEEILNFLSNDPALGPRINEARRQGHKDEEIANFLGGVATSAGATQSRTGEPISFGSEAEQAAKKMINERSRFQNFVEGGGRGIEEMVLGTKQSLAHLGANIPKLSNLGDQTAGPPVGMVSPEKVAEIDEQVKRQQAGTEFLTGQRPEAAAGRLGGNIAALGPLSLIPGQKERKLGQLIAENVAGGLAFPVTDTENFGQEKAKQAGLGALGALGARGLSRTGAKTANIFKGKLTPGAEELEGLAKRYDVPISAGDISNNPFTKKIEVGTESIPLVGFSGFRDKQQKMAARAAGEFVDGFSVNSDWGRILQSSIKDKADVVRKSGRQLFGKLENLSDPLGNVPTGNMNKTASELLQAEMSKAPSFQNQKMISELEKYTADPESNFSGLRNILSDLNDDISDFYSGKNAIIGKKDVQKLQQIADAINKDLEGFATTHGPEIKAAWKRANSFWRQRVIPFKDSALAKAMKSDTPDEIYKAFIKRDKSDRAQKFFNALDKRGKDAVRFGILEEAMDAAISENRPFSPARFARSIENNKAAIDIFYRYGGGVKKSQLEGLAKLMRHIERAGQFAENPPTGNRVIPILLAGGFAFDPQVAGGITGLAAGVRLLFGTQAGKRLLFAANKLEPGSTAMQKALDELEVQFARGLGLEVIKMSQ